MLSIIGFSMMFVFLFLIMSKKMSPLVALIIVPIITVILTGNSLNIGDMMIKGIKNTSITGVMIIFSILYFSLMSDTGLFLPLIKLILKRVNNNPIKVTVGTAILSIAVAFDGESTSTYLIVVTALFPLYKKLKLNPLILICIVTLTSGIMNMLPWSAPSARVISVLKINSSNLFTPMAPILILGLISVLLISFYLGKKEYTRLKNGDFEIKYSNNDVVSEFDESLMRPKLIYINLILTASLIIMIALDILPIVISFMVFFAIALIINYPDFKTQQKIIKRHAANALLVSSIIFSAGIFTGILEGTGIIKAMGQDVINIIPSNYNNSINYIFATLSIPFTFLFTNDAFYYGILPVLGDAASHFNVPSENVGRSGLIGQVTHLLSPLVPSSYLLSSLVGVEYSEHLKYSIKWALLIAIILLISSIIIGIV